MWYREQNNDIMSSASNNNDNDINNNNTIPASINIHHHRRRRRRRRRLLVVSLSSIWLVIFFSENIFSGLLSLAFPMDEESSSSATTTTTTSSSSSWYVRITLDKWGSLQGLRTGGVDFFGGIPYAAPPVGNLRWAPPQEPPSWKPHVLDATQFGPDCYQIIDPLLNPSADPNHMSEDCLYLNVYTPAGASNNKNNNNHNHKLPVMVWFHGGAFQQGAAKRPEYDGRTLVQDGNVIVVTANYRLGSLGFLVSSELGVLGNYGLMDQRAVLYWVQQHISTFGGNADSITLFGESAGAVMIGLHLSMDNPNLFHRAILQSNPMGYQFRSVVVADFLGDALRRAVDCRDLACLQGEPVEEIMRAQSSLMGIPRSVGDFFAWGPTLTHQRQVAWNAASAAASAGSGGGGGGSNSNSNTGGGGRSSTSGSPSSSSSLTNDHSGMSSRWKPSRTDFSTTLLLEERSLFSVETYAKQRESTKFSVNVSQPLLNLHLIPDEIPIIIGTNKHEGEMFVHSAFPLTMSKAVYWMFVGALFKDSASRVLKHYRTYVTQLETEAQEIAEQQLLEEEHKQYYSEHSEELEEEYAWRMAQQIISHNNKNKSKRDKDDQIISPETVEQLVQTFNSGGAQPNENDNSPLTEGDRGGTANSTLPWWRRAIHRLLEKPDPAVLEARRIAREERIKERARNRALKEAAKVVVDYRPVMSRIINDYLFRCPSWQFAHLLSRNRVQKETNNNNVYVYRFSQPTHVPGYKECWGKSCHTAELPYVFRSMDVIRSNYSTLSKIAQMEAPEAPEYPYTSMMNAYREILEELDKFNNSNSSTTTTTTTTIPDKKDDDVANMNTQNFHGSAGPSAASGSSSQSGNHTTSFQRILKHFFDDYFQRDADDEISSDMAKRWIAFARTDNPNYEDSKVEWVPWRYIPANEGGVDSPSSTTMDDPLEGFTLEDEFWDTAEDSESWEDNEARLGRALRERALQALNMEVIEEDELRTELRRTKATKPDPDNPFFSLKFLSHHLGMAAKDEVTETTATLPREAVRQVQRAAQEMGVLGRGMRIEESRGGGRQSSHERNTAGDFFPQLLELMWPPESRLVERDCTCEFWDRIRYRY